ncbi:hypothetical protein KL86SPO_70259 [uncultured Sporomusa sp.]|uniref:Uncharacterized protein n=1 Tax=uncultured Sporomusa sp. TaxID=307249 RepID=A0A212M0V0_9FIRM|nr:hypothetical protein KL86SPO_70259 [uncultured Sporomusa sp.]
MQDINKMGFQFKVIMQRLPGRLLNRVHSNRIAVIGYCGWLFLRFDNAQRLLPVSQFQDRRAAEAERQFNPPRRTHGVTGKGLADSIKLAVTGLTMQPAPVAGIQKPATAAGLFGDIGIFTIPCRLLQPDKRLIKFGLAPGTSKQHFISPVTGFTQGNLPLIVAAGATHLTGKLLYYIGVNKHSSHYPCIQFTLFKENLTEKGYHQNNPAYGGYG